MKTRWIAGGKIAGETSPVALRVVEGRIAARAPKPPEGADVLDVSGHWLCPMVLDAHVHLAFVAGLKEPLPEDAQARLVSLSKTLVSQGVAAVLDLGMPVSALPLAQRLAPLTVITAGPLLCAPRGYPTQSWGAGGFGLELDSEHAAREAVAKVVSLGATLVKLSLDARFPLLKPEVAKAAADEAHRRGLTVCAHALEVAGVRAALAAGVDVLAHTPAEPLPEALVKDLGARKVTVLSTLHAFGGSEALLDNLARLKGAGARVVYGTDLGNQDTAPTVLEAELTLLERAGLSPQEIVHACTLEAAKLMGLRELGTLTEGARAQLLVLPEDPMRDATVLSRPAFVIVGGERV
ncbi:MAG: amidohydrolase family protein [Deltaproteobacteria bacterium]|nr:amidohydrolase family protein [Deltaproteobacteria bacterium]